MDERTSLNADELTSQQLLAVIYYNAVIVTENHLHSVTGAVLRVNVY